MAADEPSPAPGADATLARWERGERRRSVALAALAVALAVQLVVGAVLVVALGAVALELRRRDDVLAVLTGVAEQRTCADALEARFLADVGAVVASVDRPSAVQRLVVDAELLEQVAAGALPCGVAEANPREP